MRAARWSTSHPLPKMPIDFQFEDADTLTAQLNEILAARGAEIKAVPVSALRQGIFELLALCQEIAPKKTSTFVRSITAVVIRISEDASEGKVGSPLEYARYLEEGTGVFGPKGQPITIVAKNAKGLFWGAYDGKGNALIRKKVIVQGMKARPTFSTAIAQFLPRYQQIVQDHVSGWAA
jgi:Bacteriophage HK97-gp10, putative tail-component